VLLATGACSSSQGGAASGKAGGGADARAGAAAGGSTGGTLSPATGGSDAAQAGTGAETSGSSGTSTAGGFGGMTGTGGAMPSGGMTSTGGMPGSSGRGARGGASGRMNANGGISGGAAGSGASGSGAEAGAPGDGTPVCGTAAENDSVTLTCPAGQIIDAVTFASYGTPTGKCGSFAVSDCNATTSQATIESACVGRSACSVTAANGTFGDPCHSVTKSIAVEVSCVPGQPTQQQNNAPYKGIANSPAAQLSALGATWCYNWGATPSSTDCADPLFVPMIWGSGDVASAIQAIGKAGYKTVLGFNEPNKSDQANMSVADAIALWPDLTSDPNIRVGSPAVSDDGRSWLEDFMTQAKQKGLRVDFIAMHWYGWNSGSCVASQLEGAVTWASQWGLPVWITEFGCMGSSNPDAQTVLSFFNNAIPMLAKHPLVERYAWYPWNTYNDLYSSNTMTALGQAFAAEPQYHP
jgi:hypothetical protein